MAGSAACYVQLIHGPCHCNIEQPPFLLYVCRIILQSPGMRYDGVLAASQEHNLELKAFCGMDRDIVYRYRDDDVSDYECLQFLAYCAIRSILGRGLFDDCFPVPKRITWEFILSRMAGNNKRVPVEDMPPFIAAYAARRKRDKLRKSLIYKWHVQVDGQSRGKGGAYYMIHDSIPIAQAIEDLKNYKKVARKWRKKGQADADRLPLS